MGRRPQAPPWHMGRPGARRTAYCQWGKGHARRHPKRHDRQMLVTALERDHRFQHRPSSDGRLPRGTWCPAARGSPVAGRGRHLVAARRPKGIPNAVVTETAQFRICGSRFAPAARDSNAVSHTPATACAACEGESGHEEGCVRGPSQHLRRASSQPSSVIVGPPRCSSPHSR